jgi:hypothetical protein
MRYDIASVGISIDIDSGVVSPTTSVIEVALDRTESHVPALVQSANDLLNSITHNYSSMTRPVVIPVRSRGGFARPSEVLDFGRS